MSNSQIDVSDVILDPTVAGQSFLVIRRQQIVNGFGETTVVTQQFQIVGSIVPTGDNSLVREEAYQVQGKTIVVVTLFRLRGESKESGQQFQPDLVQFNNDFFLVKTIEDYSRYGQGLIAAECASTDYVDDAPPQSAPVVGKVDYSQPQNSALIGV